MLCSRGGGGRTMWSSQVCSHHARACMHGGLVSKERVPLEGAKHGTFLLMLCALVPCVSDCLWILFGGRVCGCFCERGACGPGWRDG